MIVPLSINHIDEVYAIEIQSFSDPWSKQSFVELLSSPFAVCFTAVDAENEVEEVIGYIIMYHIFSEGQILNIAVKETHREKKVATEMFNAVLEYARNVSIETLTLEVRESNSPAIRLYTKLGFKLSGIRKGYYKQPKENAILMTLIL